MEFGFFPFRGASSPFLFLPFSICFSRVLTDTERERWGGTSKQLSPPLTAIQPPPPHFMSFVHLPFPPLLFLISLCLLSCLSSPWFLSDPFLCFHPPLLSGFCFIPPSVFFSFLNLSFSLGSPSFGLIFFPPAPPDSLVFPSHSHCFFFFFNDLLLANPPRICLPPTGLTLLLPLALQSSIIQVPVYWMLPLSIFPSSDVAWHLYERSSLRLNYVCPWDTTLNLMSSLLPLSFWSSMPLIFLHCASFTVFSPSILIPASYWN